jgi:hypothetical protein
MDIQITEKDLQKQVFIILTNLGYHVFETGKARSMQKCKACGSKQYATGWQGNTPGLPDLYVHSKQWQRGMAVGIELKTQKGTVRDTQKTINELGYTFICRSVGCALRAILSIEIHMDNTIKVNQLKKVIDINGF